MERPSHESQISGCDQLDGFGVLGSVWIANGGFKCESTGAVGLGRERRPPARPAREMSMRMRVSVGELSPDEAGLSWRFLW